MRNEDDCLVLSNWIKVGLIKKDQMKFQWTRTAKKLIPARVRQTLMAIISGTQCPKSMIGQLKRYGFNKRGYYEKEKG